VSAITRELQTNSSKGPRQSRVSFGPVPSALCEKIGRLVRRCALLTARNTSCSNACSQIIELPVHVGMAAIHDAGGVIPRGNFYFFDDQIDI
jgi:hypothetical protein